MRLTPTRGTPKTTGSSRRSSSIQRENRAIQRAGRKMERLAFDPGKILEAIDNEESVFIIDGKRTTQNNLEMHFRQLFRRAIDGEMAAARLIANMLPRFFGPEEKGPSDVKFVVKPDEFFDPKNRDNQNNEQSEIRPGNSKGRTKNTSQPISPRSAFRRVALD